MIGLGCGLSTVRRGASAPVVTESIWYDGTTPTGTSTSEASTGINLGTRLIFGAAGKVYGVAWWKRIQSSGDGEVGFWQESGTPTLLASKTFTGLTGSGWKYVTFDTPVDVTATDGYSAGVLIKPVAGNVYYLATSNFFAATGASSTNITAPISDGGVVNGMTKRNGMYTYDAALARPVNNFNHTNYWVDVGFAAA